jgi:hypothetical protein
MAMTALPSAPASPARPERLGRVRDRRERRAQLVGEHRDELVLGSPGRERRLRGLEAARPIGFEPANLAQVHDRDVVAARPVRGGRSEPDHELRRNDSAARSQLHLQRLHLPGAQQRKPIEDRLHGLGGQQGDERQLGEAGGHQEADRRLVRLDDPQPLVQHEERHRDEVVEVGEERPRVRRLAPRVRDVLVPAAGARRRLAQPLDRLHRALAPLEELREQDRRRLASARAGARTRARARARGGARAAQPMRDGARRHAQPAAAAARGSRPSRISRSPLPSSRRA